MKYLQAKHTREMEEFKSANSAYGSELWKLENNNRTNNARHRSSEDFNQMRRRAPDYPHPSNRISPSTFSGWNNNNKRNHQIQRKTSWINDPEVKRQRRVVKYKAYAVEGKMKASIRNSLRWVKNKYYQLVHGY